MKLAQTRLGGLILSAWLAAALHVGANKAYEYGLYPFIIGDAIKMGLAAAVLPAAWAFVKRGRDGDDV